MATSISVVGSASSVQSTRRFWVRRDTPIWPFVWRGLLPLLLLLLLVIYALLPFAREDIEAAVLAQTRAGLTAQGFAWVQVAVSGQDVTLSGTQPTAGAGEAALAIARQAKCPSWAGQFSCAISVSGQFSDPAAGQFSDPAPRTLAPPVVSETPAAPAAVVCEKSLADIVAQTQIEFATASAAIHERSAPVLDALAKAAGQCGGVIRVEGFTDSTGNAQLNRTLSTERAAAVAVALIQRGLPADRIVSLGYGADRPIGDNATEAGRASNRRIEFRVDTDQKH